MLSRKLTVRRKLYYRFTKARFTRKKVGDKMEVTYYRGSKEMKATIDLTIDKSALTQQNNRSQ